MKENCLLISFSADDPNMTEAADSLQYALRSQGHGVRRSDLRFATFMPRFNDLFHKVYIVGHGDRAIDCIGQVTVSTAAACLAAAGNFLEGTVFTLICCHSALPFIRSQRQGEMLPYQLPAAVKFLNSLIACGVRRPVVHAYAGKVALVNPKAVAHYARVRPHQPLAIGQPMIILEPERMNFISRWSNYLQDINPHLFDGVIPGLPDQHSIRPSILPASKWAYSYNSEGLLEVLVLAGD